MSKLVGFEPGLIMCQNSDTALWNNCAGSFFGTLPEMWKSGFSGRLIPNQLISLSSSSESGMTCSVLGVARSNSTGGLDSSELVRLDFLAGHSKLLSLSA